MLVLLVVKTQYVIERNDKMKTYMLCGKPGSCCPSLTIDEDRVQIRFDDGAIGVMTREQFEIMQKVEA